MERSGCPVTKASSAEPDWEAPAGMVKKQCVACEHWFASNGAATCPSCLAGGSAKGRQLKASAGPFDGYSGGRQIEAKKGS